MPLTARHLIPVVEPRRRPNHRPDGRPPAAFGPPPQPSPLPFEPDSPGRALAIAALAVIRDGRRPGDRPTAWSRPGFAREVDLVRLHLRLIRTRQVLAASFGREAFHAGPSPAGAAIRGPVTVAYAIRWLELGDLADRPGFGVWLAESAAVPAERCGG